MTPPPEQHPLLQQLQGIADDIRADIKQARADDDDEHRSYLRGELQGVLTAYDLVHALQLTEEFGHDVKGRKKPNPQVLMGSDGRPAGTPFEPPDGWTQYRRWVSPWVSQP